MLNPEQEARIESGLAECLNECRATDRPYTRISALIADLQSHPDWTSAEIVELQTRVIRVLLYRHGRPHDPVDV